MNVKHPPTVLGNDDGPRAVLGLRLLCGFIGASLLAGGVVQLLTGEGTPLSVLLAVAGGVWAALSWRGAVSDLESGTATSAAPSKAPLPRLPGTVVAH